MSFDVVISYFKGSLYVIDVKDLKFSNNMLNSNNMIIEEIKIIIVITIKYTYSS